MTERLEDIEAKLRGLCEPRCGRVVLEASTRTSAAELEPVESRVSRLVYNEDFINSVARTYGGSALYAVVGHEYAHHLDESPPQSSFSRELRADALAGCAVARCGAPLGPALSWMRHEHFEETLHEVYRDPKDPDEVVHTYVGHTHPVWIDRIGALAHGAAVCRAANESLALGDFFDRASTSAIDLKDQSGPLIAGLPIQTVQLANVLEEVRSAWASTAEGIRFGRYSRP